MSWQNVKSGLYRWLGVVLAVVLLAASLACAIGAFVVASYPDQEFWSGLLAGLATTFFGSALTVGLIDWLLALRRKHEHIASIGPQTRHLIDLFRLLQSAHENYLSAENEPTAHGLVRYGLALQDATTSADQIRSLVNELNPALAALLAGFITKARSHLTGIDSVTYAVEQKAKDRNTQVERIRDGSKELLQETTAITAGITKVYELSDDIAG